MALDLDAIACAWERIYLAEKGGAVYKDNFWAFHELSDLVDDDPESAFLVMQMIWGRSDDQQVLANLAAGPLEDFLVKHGGEFITRIENLARADRKLSMLLGHVWRNNISDEVWGRLNAILTR